MKYKFCRSNSIRKKTKINNTITTVNLKIKDIHILLDDINTTNNNNNIYMNQKRHSTKKYYNTISKELSNSPLPKGNSNKIYYHKRNKDSLKQLNKFMKTIQIND
jgi:hypothetical protein